MSTNKKSSSKASKSPTPATKSAKPASKKTKAVAATEAPAPAAPVAVKAAEPVKPSVKPIEVAPPVAAVAPQAIAPAVNPAALTSVLVAAPVAPVAIKALVTTIRARINVGFGNLLYLRGEGAGLSWDRGVVMTNVAADEWQITLPESSRPVVFKFLVNDLTWSTGPDYSVVPGTSTAVTPSF